MPKKGLVIPPSGGDVIRDRLKACGWSQEKFSTDILGMTDRTLRNWLVGGTSIDEHNLETMLMHLGIGVGDVFQDKLPSAYREKSTLSQFVGTFKKLVMGGDVNAAFKKYKNYIKGLFDHVSFHRIPLYGPYFMFDHDETHCHHYAVISLDISEDVDQATFVLSWRFLNLIRVNLGEVLVTKEEVTVKPFFQKYPHTVKLKGKNAPVLFGFWLARDGSLFFLENKDKGQVNAKVVEFISEKQHDDRSEEIAVFWRGVPIYE